MIPSTGLSSLWTNPRYTFPGLLYLIFDLEIIFIFPFISIIFLINSFVGFWIFLLFLIILAFGFIYEYVKGSLHILPSLS